jgi:hypothetical protein
LWDFKNEVSNFLFSLENKDKKIIQDIKSFNSSNKNFFYTIFEKEENIFCYEIVNEIVNEKNCFKIELKKKIKIDDAEIFFMEGDQIDKKNVLWVFTDKKPYLKIVDVENEKLLDFDWLKNLNEKIQYSVDKKKLDYLSKNKKKNLDFYRNKKEI